MVRGKFSLAKLQVAKKAKIGDRSTTDSVVIGVISGMVASYLAIASLPMFTELLWIQSNCMCCV